MSLLEKLAQMNPDLIEKVAFGSSIAKAGIGTASAKLTAKGLGAAQKAQSLAGTSMSGGANKLMKKFTPAKAMSTAPGGYTSMQKGLQAPGPNPYKAAPASQAKSPMSKKTIKAAPAAGAPKSVNAGINLTAEPSQMAMTSPSRM